MKARANPFAVDRVLRIRYELADETLEELIARLMQLGGRGAIVGPHGSGKTTLLEDLTARLEQRGTRVHLVRLSAERRVLPRETLAALSRALCDVDAVLCDGAEQLGRFAWQAFRYRARQARLFVVTTHQPGRLPTLLQTHTTPELLDSIVRRLLRMPDESLPFSVSELFARHEGNLRDALRELYDRCANGELDFATDTRPAHTN